MKKTNLALAAAGAIVALSTLASSAHAAVVYDKDGNSLEVYGRVQSVLYSGKVSGVSNEETSMSTSGRLGLNMRSALTSDVAAFANAEWEAANGDSEETFSARYLFVGLDFGQFGLIKAGKFEPAMKYAISQTDIFEDWGAVGLTSADDRRNGVVQYEWSGAGFDVLFSYAFAKDGDPVGGAWDLGEAADIQSSVSAAAGYTSPDVLFGPVAVRFGFESGQFADGKVDDGTGKLTEQNATGQHRFDDYRQFAAGLSWGSADLGPYFAAQYQQRKFNLASMAAGVSDVDYKVTGLEFVASYALENGLTASTGYLTTETETEGEKIKAAVVPVFVNYQVNDQFNVWAEARFDADTDNTSDKNYDLAMGTNFSENAFSAGMRYAF